MIRPNTMDFPMASHRLESCTALGNANMKYSGDRPIDKSEASMPPNSAAAVVQAANSGITSASAMARGSTRR